MTVQAGLAAAGRQAAEIGHAIAGYAVASCDIFDTAVMRRLARPEDVLLAAGLRLQAAGLTDCDPAAFQLLRRQAERSTRAAAEAAGHDEVRIGEIYAHLHACGVVRDPVAAAAIEFAAECAACQSIAAVHQALAARPPGQRLVFVSDSIWPAAQLAQLLEGCGYGAECQVFASADHRRSKHAGGLFALVAAALGCRPADIVHLGDNPHSDGVQARAAGFAAHILPWRMPPPEPEADAALPPLARLAHSHRRSRAATATGDPPALSQYAALLLIGFSFFVLAEARRRGAPRIFFLARDGYLPLAVARRIIARTGQVVTLDYLHVSRHAVVTEAADPAGRAAALAYLRHAGFIAEDTAAPPLIVDVGWRGSLQTSLAELTGRPVAGCYLGLWAEALRPALSPSNAAGYLFAFGHPAPRAAIVREGYILLEMLFSAPHGTVIGYSAAGAPLHAPEAEPAGTVRRNALAALEADTLALVETLGDLIGGAWPEHLDPDAALFDIAGVLASPTAAQVAQFNAIPFIHAADPADPALRVAVNRVPPHEFLLQPRAVLRRLHDAPWRAGALRASLPWPLPSMDFPTFRDRFERLLRLVQR